MNYNFAYPDLMEHGRVIIVNTPCITLNIGARFFKDSSFGRKSRKKNGASKKSRRKRRRRRNKNSPPGKIVSEGALDENAPPREAFAACSRCANNVAGNQLQLPGIPFLQEDRPISQKPAFQGNDDSSRMENPSDSSSENLPQDDETSLFFHPLQFLSPVLPGIQLFDFGDPDAIEFAGQTPLDKDCRSEDEVDAVNRSRGVSMSDSKPDDASFFVKFQYKPPSSVSPNTSENMVPADPSEANLTMAPSFENEFNTSGPRYLEPNVSNYVSEVSSSELSSVSGYESATESTSFADRVIEDDLSSNHRLLSSPRLQLDPQEPVNKSLLITLRYNPARLTNKSQDQVPISRSPSIIELSPGPTALPNAESATAETENSRNRKLWSLVKTRYWPSVSATQNYALKRVGESPKHVSASETLRDSNSLDETALSHLKIPKFSDTKTKPISRKGEACIVNNQRPLCDNFHKPTSSKVSEPCSEESQQHESHKSSRAKENDTGNYYAINRICEVCAWKFTNEISFCYHMQRHQKSKVYQCQVCHKCLFTLDLHRLHMLVSHGVKNLQNKDLLCHFQSSTPPEFHFRAHSRHNLLQCFYCDMWFRTVPHLRSHQNIHHCGRNPFRCNYCRTRFDSKSLFDRHCQPQKEPHQCQCGVCWERVLLMEDLANHMITHESFLTRSN